jgi:hypothetical protein
MNMYPTCTVFPGPFGSGVVLVRVQVCRIQRATEQLGRGPLNNMHRVNPSRAFRYLANDARCLCFEVVEIHRPLTGIGVLIAAIASRRGRPRTPNPEAKRRRSGLPIPTRFIKAPVSLNTTCSALFAGVAFTAANTTAATTRAAFPITGIFLTPVFELPGPTPELLHITHTCGRRRRHWGLCTVWKSEEQQKRQTAKDVSLPVSYVAWEHKAH